MGRTEVGEDVVVVLNYHGRADTERCVDSLVTGSPEMTVLVVDNGSKDGTLDAVQARHPQVHTIASRDNLGFSGGMNLGLRWAVDRGAASATVLNNDTIIPPGAFRPLVAAAGEGAAVSPEVRYADGSGRVWFGGGTIDAATGLPRHLSAEELDRMPTDGAGRRPTPILAGCCVTASGETWRRVGLFDDRFFLNFEDSDWSLRARRAGVPLVVEPAASIDHAVSASFVGAYSYLGLFYYARNGLLFVRGSLGGSRAQATRFLRRHVAPVVGADLRDRVWGQLWRHLVVVAAALAGHAAGRYGRAPRWLETLTHRWAAR